MKNLDLLIVDDHPIFRKGLKDILEIALTKVSIQEAENGEQAIHLLTQHTFDLVLLDIDMPKIDGFQVCKHLKTEQIEVKIIFLTMYKDENVFLSAMETGADGFLLKDNSAEEIITCLQTVLNHKKYVSSQIASYESTYLEHLNKKKQLKNLLRELTQTEMRTLKLVSENYSSKEIADLLFVTPKSVENYRSRICKKLGLELGSNSLIKWTLENKELLKQLEW